MVTMTDSQFLASATPDMQHVIASDTEDCFFGDYPTLAAVGCRYGKDIAVAWLVPQLANLSEYCGARDKLTGPQIEELAYIISSEFFYLKISEMMLFFHRFKAGRYGRFYGSVDPMVVTIALHEFVRERSNAIDRHDREEALKKIDAGRKNAITYEQYCINHGIYTEGSSETGERRLG